MAIAIVIVHLEMTTEGFAIQQLLLRLDSGPAAERRLQLFLSCFSVPILLLLSAFKCKSFSISAGKKRNTPFFARKTEKESRSFVPIFSSVNHDVSAKISIIQSVTKKNLKTFLECPLSFLVQAGCC